MQATINIPQEWLPALEEAILKTHLSREELIQKVLTHYLAELQQKTHNPFANHPAFGSWKDLGVDGVKYQQKLRDEWES